MVQLHVPAEGGGRDEVKPAMVVYGLFLLAMVLWFLGDLIKFLWELLSGVFAILAVVWGRG